MRPNPAMNAMTKARAQPITVSCTVTTAPCRIRLRYPDQSVMGCLVLGRWGARPISTGPGHQLLRRRAELFHRGRHRRRSGEAVRLDDLRELTGFLHLRQFYIEGVAQGLVAFPEGRAIAVDRRAFDRSDYFQIFVGGL